MCFCQTYQWTGANSNDFFEENNWVDISTNNPPVSGSIDPNANINVNLNIQNSADVIYANALISLGVGSLNIENAELSGSAISNGQLVVNNDAYINLSDSNPLQDNINVLINSQIAWLKLENVKPNLVNSNFINQIQINQQNAVYQTNLRLDNYYLEGTIVRSIDSSNKPLEIFDNENLQGNLADIDVDIIWSSQSNFNSQPIPNGLDNKIESFVLKKGFMVTFAINEDGTGKSKNYIASEEDLIINELPHYLKNEISFIRVMPWNWVNKKGRGGGGTSTVLDNTWFYHWNNNMQSTFQLEYGPMAWGANGANSDAAISNYIGKEKVTHVLAFNESDNCNGQSGQYNNLCQVDVAVDIYKNLMKTGLRLVSPNGRENAPFGWLKEFHDKANAQDIRIDVIGVHWYDWGSNPENSPNADPNLIFQRFVNYLNDVHNLYGLPIWITEFNANPNRTNAVNHAFMQLALPYLESLDYVERYAWFEPNSDVADYQNTNGNLTNIGTTYKNQVSTPSIPENTLTLESNLDLYYNLLDPTGENLIFNGFYESGDLIGWSGNNIDIVSNPTNVFEGTTSARIKSNTGELYQFVDVKPNTEYNLSFYTRWFVSPSNPIDVQILNTNDDSIIATQTMTTNTNWNFIEMDFVTPNNVNEIKLLFEKGDEPGWFIDNAIMFEGETLSVFDYKKDYNIKIYPNPTSNFITIESTNNITSVIIYNIQGHQLKNLNNINKQQIGININDLSKGLYIIETHLKENKIFTQKIIKN